MQEYNISQLPVLDGNEFTGSLDDSRLFQMITKDPSLAEKTVGEVMEKPFPVVNAQADVKEVSRHITRDVSAVLVKLPDNQYHIITKHDIIGALS